MRKAIVSGANGFIGSAVVQELIKNDYHVIALSRKDDNIPRSKMISFVEFDLMKVNNVKGLLMNEKADIFYNFAWAGSSGQERKNTDLQLNNVSWNIECLKLANEVGCKRFINAGSFMEREVHHSVLESNDVLGMGYIYSIAKYTAHAMCNSIAKELGIELIWPLITNAYGIGENSSRLVNTTIRKCIKGIEPCFTSGLQNYDFVYIDDVARAFRMIGENGKPFQRYLIGSSEAKSLKEFLLEMKEAIAPDLNFNFGNVPFNGVNVPLIDYNCDSTERDTGFRASISFAEGCRITKDWLMSSNEGEK